MLLCTEQPGRAKVGGVIAVLATAMWMARASAQSTEAPTLESQTDRATELRAYLIDPTGQLTIDGVKGKPDMAFKPFDRALSLGYTADTIWLRLRIDPSVGRAQAAIDGKVHTRDMGDSLYRSHGKRSRFSE